MWRVCFLMPCSSVTADTFNLQGKVPGPGEASLWQRSQKLQYKSSDTQEVPVADANDRKPPVTDAVPVKSRMSDAMVTQVMNWFIGLALTSGSLALSPLCGMIGPVW